MMRTISIIATILFCLMFLAGCQTEGQAIGGWPSRDDMFFRSEDTFKPAEDTKEPVLLDSAVHPFNDPYFGLRMLELERALMEIKLDLDVWCKYHMENNAKYSPLPGQEGESYFTVWVTPNMGVTCEGKMSGGQVTEVGAGITLR
ncbi:hypothetical protein KY310_01530 [Candidatus Woesearchaeota archaeon]|nr:hypothetical protein [Candidatus Woesearchaeota archaeon]